MTERIRSFLTVAGIPLLMFAFALGAAQYQLNRVAADKEDKSVHNADIQRLEAQQDATYSLLLDVRCQQQPSDRRCK